MELTYRTLTTHSCLTNFWIEIDPYKLLFSSLVGITDNDHLNIDHVLEKVSALTVSEDKYHKYPS